MDISLNRTLALAGIIQMAIMVKRLAWHGAVDEKNLEMSVVSLFNVNADTTLDVYQYPERLKEGLETLIQIFGSDQKQMKDQEIVRYLLSLMHLERSLSRRKDLLDIISKGLARAKSQAKIFSLTHDNVMANLAGIYTDTLSTMKFRIYVTGEPTHLSNPVTAHKVRTLLLSGIRSAVLWRQLGGTRWQLIFARKKIVMDAQKLLSELIKQSLAQHY